MSALDNLNMWRFSLMPCRGRSKVLDTFRCMITGNAAAPVSGAAAYDCLEPPRLIEWSVHGFGIGARSLHLYAIKHCLDSLTGKLGHGQL